LSPNPLPGKTDVLWDPPIGSQPGVVASGPKKPDILWDPPFGQQPGVVDSQPQQHEVFKVELVSPHLVSVNPIQINFQPLGLQDQPPRPGDRSRFQKIGFGLVGDAVKEALIGFERARYRARQAAIAGLDAVKAVGEKGHAGVIDHFKESLLKCFSQEFLEGKTQSGDMARKIDELAADKDLLKAVEDELKKEGILGQDETYHPPQSDLTDLKNAFQ
jgi:hypothetical protein